MMTELIKDKVAIIFHGIVGGIAGRNGIGDPNNIEDCFKTIKYNILSHYDYDVFAHSWSINQAELIKSLYNPVESLFEPQEYFGFSGVQASEHPEAGQSFRTISRYTSLERAVNLKKKYEIENSFKYKWVLVLRYDLVFFRKLDLSNYDPQFMYICSEPHWDKNDIPNNSLFHDIIFLSSSLNIDRFSTFSSELKNGIYNSADAHSAVCQKILNLFNGNPNMVKRGFKRYIDTEIYRMAINPSLNPVGHAYGALETKNQLTKLLKEIDNG